jgi:hypothetical protein
MLLRKLLVFLAGFVTGSIPPEALVILMEPPPGEGRLPPDVAARARGTEARRALRHRHPMRRTPASVRSDRTPPTRPG